MISDNFSPYLASSRSCHNQTRSFTERQPVEYLNVIEVMSYSIADNEKPRNRSSEDDERTTTRVVAVCLGQSRALILPLVVQLKEMLHIKMKLYRRVQIAASVAVVAEDVPPQP